MWKAAVTQEACCRSMPRWFKSVMLPENTIESASMNVSTNLLQSSDMISILSLRLAQRYASQGQLVILNLPKIEQKGSVGVFWRNNETPSAALNRFLYFLAQV
ncbi:LysR substrate-binding domain-containing protein [Trabulsiella odontotermitis]|uniref:LysR substrate-binding domain-containing protein n=1 Tax=Trabulsiella odontotermitis TaxID=379893 RepID=UPI003AD1552D